jgi:hypothetical protein
MVRDRLASGTYQDFDALEKELLLIFENAMAYNPPEHIVYKVCVYV